MTRRVLCVDDEPNVLQAFERQFHRRFDLLTAIGPERALETLQHEGPFAVVVSDLRMPVMDGVEFLSRVRQQWPDTVRIMLTGQADLNMAMAAVNQGHIFQFLSKPCPADMLARALDAGIDHYRLVTAERELLEETLKSSIAVMTEILSLVNPVAFSRAERIRRYVLHIAGELNLPGHWQFELAAMLSQIGCVAVPPEVLEKYYDAQPLDVNERSILASQGQLGHRLLARIPRMEEIAEMIGNQHLSRRDLHAGSETVATGSGLLKVALDFDELLMRSQKPAAALLEMRKRGSYDPRFLNALEQVHVHQEEREVRLVGLAELKTGMTTNADVYSKSGLLLMGAGQEITASAIARLHTFAMTKGVVVPLSVRMPHARVVPQPVEAATGMVYSTPA